MKRGLIAAASIGILSAALAAAPAPAQLTHLGTPILIGAGDIACDPKDPNFSGANASYCQHRATGATVKRFLDSGAATHVFNAGDNQYEQATKAQFDASYKQSGWGAVIPKTLAIAGNHEYEDPAGNAAGFRATFPMWATDRDISTVRTLGAWNIYLINSNCAEGINCAALASWMKSHMLQNRKRCTMAIWHHPHRSSTAYHSIGTSRQFADAFDAGRGDVVIQGHAHNLSISKKVNPDGTLDGTNGVKYFTVGGGGQSLFNFASSTMPSWEEWRAKKFGVLRIALYDTAYDYWMLDKNGTVLTSGHRTCSV